MFFLQMEEDKEVNEDLRFQGLNMFFLSISVSNLNLASLVNVPLSHVPFLR